MPTLKDLLSTRVRQTRGGVVIRHMGLGRYRVRTEGRVVLARGEAGAVSPGSRVTLALTADGWSIVSSGRSQAREAFEVTIDG